MNITRYNTIEKIEKSGYNVREECKKLEKKYCLWSGSCEKNK